MGIIFSDLAVSADGYATGLNQTEERPFGDVDDSWLHNWMFDAYEENKAEVDAIVTSGATIMGRNMFGPVRGEWDRDWRGWWGPNPPYHNPVFVLTHHPHEPIEMEGGTTFHFITDGIERALELARDAAGEQDISIAGGPCTVNQFLTAG
ncbi:MAG: 5-amino-6-(5-phosphoribosylamino)uracil reductase, partial [Actinobacteria bacterium HGW-Actinobacteria-11]